MDQFTFLFTAGICILAALLVGLAFYHMYLDAQKARQAVDRAIPATARVLRVGASDASSDGIDVDLTFEVTPPFGEPYKVKAAWSVEPLAISKLQEGSTLAVKIDAKDPWKIYSAENWAWAIGQLPPEAAD